MSHCLARRGRSGLLSGVVRDFAVFCPAAQNL